MTPNYRILGGGAGSTGPTGATGIGLTGNTGTTGATGATGAGLSLTIKDEGATIATGISVLDITGTGVNALTGAPGEVSINVPTVIPPPPLGGYWASGYSTNIPDSPTQNIDRLAFATDTVAMVTAENIGITGYPGSGGFNSTLRGFFGRGRTTNSVSVMLFSTETMSTTGAISTNNDGEGQAGYNSASYGYCSGGRDSLGAGPYTDTFRVDLASPSSSILSRGVLSATGEHMSGCNSSTHGYVGGDAGGALPATTTNRLDFSVDTNAMITRANLTSARQAPASFNAALYGYWAGGNSGSIVTTNSRITFASDTSSQLNRGALNTGVWHGTGCNSDIKGYVAGGQNSGLAIITTSQALTFATDTVAMASRGALTGTRWYNCACNSGGY